MNMDLLNQKGPKDPLKMAEAGEIPIRAVIEKLDGHLNREQYQQANRLLHDWLKEARALNDRRGELSLLNEMMGLSRRLQNAEEGLASVKRGFWLIDELGLAEQTCAGTVWLNGATTLKAFGRANEAVIYYHMAKENYCHNIKPNDPLMGGLYNNYALALADLDNFERAITYFQHAIQIMAQKPGGELDIAVTLMNLAELYDHMGEQEELIETCLQQALQNLNQPDLTHDGNYAFVCRKCAPTFGYFGWFKEKEELNIRADRIYEGNGTF